MKKKVNTGERKKPKERWVANVRDIMNARRLSVPPLLDEVVGKDGKGRDHLRKILYGSVASPLNPLALMKKLAISIVALSSISEKPLEEAEALLRKIIAGTAYEVGADRQKAMREGQIKEKPNSAESIRSRPNNDEVLEALRQKFKLASSHFKIFWEYADRSYQKWRVTKNPQAPSSLTKLIREAPFLRDLPLPLNADIVDWISQSQDLINNRLFNFAQHIYPPMTAHGVRPRSSILSASEFAKFDKARKEITWAFWEIGEKLLNENLQVTEMSEFFQNVTLVKFSSYLEVALPVQTDNMGPNKRGLFSLWKMIAEERGEVSERKAPHT